MMWVDKFVSCATYLKRDGSEPGDVTQWLGILVSLPEHTEDS